WGKSTLLKAKREDIRILLSMKEEKFKLSYIMQIIFIELSMCQIWVLMICPPISLSLPENSMRYLLFFPFINKKSA
ncbi:hypothetical protein V4Y02_24020, partial [Escherichia coli]